MKYRDSVCAVVQRPADGRVLLCHRRDYPPDQGWQFPQGGFEEHKGLVAEAKRELREEIGTDSVEVLRISSRAYTYDFPDYARNARPGYRGQRQRWIVASFCGADADIGFQQQPAEFDACEWVEPREALQRIVAFKKEVYRRAMSDLKLL